MEIAAPAHRGVLVEVAQTLVRHRLALVGSAVIALLVVVAAFGETLAPYGPNEVAILDRLQGPSREHLFGTDELGRDIFSRVLLAARLSLEVGAIAVGISLTAGTILGLLSGFYGRVTDSVVMRLMDMLFALPAILVAVVIVAVLGPGLKNAMIAIGIAYTPIFARIARASVLVVREAPYVRAARSLGARDLRIIRLHVLPNIVSPLIVQTSLSMAFAILSEAALSFLGLGVQPPNPSWGVMLAEGRAFVEDAPWMGIFPGLAIVATVLGFNFLGDGLRDALDPRQRSVIDSRGETS